MADGLGQLSLEQAEWVTTVSYLTSLKWVRQIPVPSHPVRRFLFWIATSRAFDIFIYVVIGLNVIEMCVWWYNMPDRVIELKEVFNKIVFGTFVVCSCFLFLVTHTDVASGSVLGNCRAAAFAAPAPGPWYANTGVPARRCRLSSWSK